MRGLLLLGVVALAGAGGCGGARYVHKDQYGGVVAMRDTSGASRDKALKLIQQHVGPGYTIVEEREVVTGQTTTNHADTQKELAMHSKVPFLPAEKQTTHTTTTTADVTEYQIVYRRAGAPPMPPMPPPVQQAGAQVPATQPPLEKSLPTGATVGGPVIQTPAK